MSFTRFLIFLSLLSLPAAADDRTAAELLPESTVIYVELTEPQQLLTTLLDHPIRTRLLELKPVREAMEKKPYLDFKAGVSLVESQMGLPWHKILRQVAGDGVVFAVDAKTKGAALLAQATDETSQAKLIELLSNLAKADATSKGRGDPIKSGEYRGMKAYALDRVKMVNFDRWFVLSNNDELVKQIIDGWLDKSEKSFAKNAQFLAARENASKQKTAWAYADIAVLRAAGVAKNLYKGQADNALAELLFGGILSTLKNTTHATMSVTLDKNQLSSIVSMGFDRAWAGDTREYLFGANGQGQATQKLLPNEAILSLSAYRDVSGMWLRAGDLFDEKANEELAKADSVLTTLFGGKDFGEDILGTLRPEVQVVVVRQSFEKGQPTPAIKLPAFALVSNLKDPQKMQPELRRTFQSLIGFVNITGAMNGQPQLELDMEKTDAMQLVMAKYLPDSKSESKNPLGVKINYNFSPTIAFAGERVILASTQQLARRLATDQPSEPAPVSQDRVTNTDVLLRFDALREILNDNHGQLVAQNMLKEGQTKEEAEFAIGMLLELIGFLDHASLQLDTSEHELRVLLNVATEETRRADGR